MSIRIHEWARRCALGAPIVFLALAAYGVEKLEVTPGTGVAPFSAGDAAMNPTTWEIGPIVRGRVHSLNMPPHPTQHPDGWAIDFPYPTETVGSVHYVTMPTGPLTGKSRVVMQYRVETQNARLVARKFPEKPGTMTLYFQRAGDNWTAEFPAHRWYASAVTHEPRPGTWEVEAYLHQGWVSVMGIPSEHIPADFDAALAGASRIGFVLGGGDGLGHGVYATGPFRLIVTSFRIE